MRPQSDSFAGRLFDGKRLTSRHRQVNLGFNQIWLRQEDALYRLLVKNSLQN